MSTPIASLPQASDPSAATSPWAAWFAPQLTSSGSGLVWALEQIPAARHWLLPPWAEYLGSWPPARHLWHVLGYERAIVLPSMRQWLGAAMPDADAWRDDDDAWREQPAHSTDGLIAAFQAIRAAQVTLLASFAAADWDRPLETIWGLQPLSMVVTKTYQHTFEHGDTLLRMALWWDRGMQAEARQRAEAGAVED